MSINTYNRHEFGIKLNTLVSPAQPIYSVQHLVGREEQLQKIEQCLYSPGRHIFIYGDRGVGKSSLAATAANQYQSSDAEYIDISCAPDSTLMNIVINIAYQAINMSRLKAKQIESKVGLNLQYFSFESGEKINSKNLQEEITTLNDAVEVLREVSLIHSESPIVVIDEFDRMESVQERSLFADLVKHLGDKRINIKIIFTGVANTIESLLGAHPSAIRQFETIELPKLSWDARMEIVNRTAEAFDLEINRDIQIRIAAVSDGYPYFVHLVTEKLMWHVFNSAEEINEIENEHYYAAIRDAISSVSAELKRPYEKAINQPSGDFEEILWSTADSEYLHRYTKDMFSSYEYVMKQLKETDSLNLAKYRLRIKKLTSSSHGEILTEDIHQKNLYSYKEKMLRGYVRLQAEAHGIELIGETKAEKTKNHMTIRASSGYHQSSVPSGVHFSRERKN